MVQKCHIQRKGASIIFGSSEPTQDCPLPRIGGVPCKVSVILLTNLNIIYVVILFSLPKQLIHNTCN